MTGVPCATCMSGTGNSTFTTSNQDEVTSMTRVISLCFVMILATGFITVVLARLSLSRLGTFFSQKRKRMDMLIWHSLHP